MSTPDDLAADYARDGLARINNVYATDNGNAAAASAAVMADVAGPWAALHSSTTS